MDLQVEIRMKAEELAARQLAEQKQAIEEERKKLEAERAAMAAENKAAMNAQVGVVPECCDPHPLLWRIRSLSL